MLKMVHGSVAKRRINPVTPVPSIQTVDVKNSAGPTTVHSLTGVPAGALLVLTTGCGNSLTNATVTSSPSLTWTKRVDSQGSNSGDAEIHTALFPAGGSITVTSNFGSTPQGSVCYVIIDGEAVQSGTTVTAANQNPSNVNITSTRANSILIGVISDWNAVDGASRSYRTAVTERQYFRSANHVTTYHFDKSAATISAYNLGLNGPAGQSDGTCILEIRGPGVPDTEPPTAPTISVDSFTATNITISMAGATDNSGIIGYDVYVNNSLYGSNLASPATISSLTPSTSYSIFVKTKDAGGNSSVNSNTVNQTTRDADSFGVLQFSNGFNTNGDINSNQLGAGVISTATKIEGLGSFKSIVPAGSGQISGGWRSEQQYDESLSPNSQPIIVQYYTRWEIFTNTQGLSCQWHGNTSGTSGQLSLWVNGQQFMVQRNVIGTAGSPNIYQGAPVGGGPLWTINLNTWYKMRWEIVFTSGNNGYVRLYIDDTLYYDSGTTKTSDGSGQYLKVGQNLFSSPNVNSTVYFDDLNVWFS